MSEPEVTLYPRWRQAVEDFLAEFAYGSLVPHGWLEVHFGMPGMDVKEKLTTAEFAKRQFEWLSNIEAFKAELLDEHRVCLQSVHGKGYRWVPPHEQTALATKDFAKDVRKTFRSVDSKLKHLRVAELTDEQRRENTDATNKISMLKGMTRKALR